LKIITLIDIESTSIERERERERDIHTKYKTYDFHKHIFLCYRTFYLKYLYSGSYIVRSFITLYPCLRELEGNIYSATIKHSNVTSSN